MNHIKLLASFAMMKWSRFIQFLISNLRETVSTALIISATCSSQGAENKGSDLRLYRQSPATSLTRTVLSGLEPIRGSEQAAKRIACSVALAIGISLCLPMSHASSGSIDAIQPKDYVRLVLPKNEAICLSRLIGKESAWNSKAIGNLASPTKSYVYGLLQIKNRIAKDLSAIEQIDLGLKYIDHRYQGNACNAWNHWLRKGWH